MDIENRVTTKLEGESYTVYVNGARIGRVYRTRGPASIRWQAARLPPSYKEVGRAATLKAAARLFLK